MTIQQRLRSYERATAWAAGIDHHRTNLLAGIDGYLEMRDELRAAYAGRRGTTDRMDLLVADLLEALCDQLIARRNRVLDA